MTQNSDPYENAIAERINGILKQEFMIDNLHLKLPLMQQIVKEVFDIYNDKRPHWTNHMLTPNQMYQQCLVEMRTDKQKNSSSLEATTV